MPYFWLRVAITTALSVITSVIMIVVFEITETHLTDPLRLIVFAGAGLSVSLLFNVGFDIGRKINTP